MSQLGKRIGQNVRRARLDASLSQAQLSKRLCYTHGRIGRIERGHGATPRIDTVVKLAHAIGVSPAALISDAGRCKP